MWDLTQENPTVITTLTGHEFGVRKLVFDPSSQYLLSLGHLHDGQVALWYGLVCESKNFNMYMLLHVFIYVICIFLTFKRDWARNTAIMKEQVVCEDETYVNDITFSADGYCIAKTLRA